MASAAALPAPIEWPTSIRFSLGFFSYTFYSYSASDNISIVDQDIENSRGNLVKSFSGLSAHM